jgi:RHS repeat-associated protein
VAFDTASRLRIVSDGTNGAYYSYVENSPLVAQIQFTNNGVRRMTTTKQYDLLNRLTNIASVDSLSAPVATFAYTYNAGGQRTQRRDTDGSYWNFGYDPLGQVTTGEKRWSDNALVAGQQFAYAFDDIGNRTWTTNNTHAAHYQANSLNQYVSRDIPGFAAVSGEANSNATVTLWGPGGSYATTARHGDYFFGELPADNSTNPVWLTITNITVLQNGTNADIVSTAAGSDYISQTPESFTYDADGNPLSDGHWNYSWDGENRLVKIAAKSGTGPQISLAFEYDAGAHRIRKQVWANTNWFGASTNDLRFPYDGWNLISTLNSGLSALNTFTWGLDLSGSLQGAGGVGGLLFCAAGSSPQCVAFDGNGNVAALVDVLDCVTTASYEYGPFGEVIRATGPMAKANPVRFSTKYQDDETDLLYYGYRYYNASTGRWLNRDFIG